MAGSRTLSASSAADTGLPLRRPAGAAASGRRFACFALSLGCAAASGTLALHHPLSPALAAVAALAAALLVAWRPDAWLLLVPALLPLIGLAPWSGWLTFEELDILVLAVAVGGYLRLGGTTTAAARDDAPQTGPLVFVGLLLFAASVLLSTLRGMTEMGGPAFGWFQGYREPMNAVRLGKSFFLAALLLPLWRRASRSTEHAEKRLAWGVSLGLAGAMLAALWERLAFTGLLDFSSDYRTTALFWETHVGGAAFDGFLALTVPFAVHLLWHARSRLQWGTAAGLLALAGYVCVTTFSRAVYVALPASLALMFALRLRAARTPARSAEAATVLPASTAAAPSWLGPALIVAFAATSVWIFPTGGYRGMLAWLGATLLLPPLAAALHGRRVAVWLAGATVGVALAGVATLLADVLPKGPYLLFGAAWFAAAAALWRAGQAGRGVRGANAWAGAALAAGLLAAWCVALVMRHWGGGLATVWCTTLVIRDWAGGSACADALPVLALWLLALPLLARGPAAVPVGARWHASLAAALVVTATLVGVFSGGAYIGGRFAAGADDLGTRMAHWQRGLATLRTPADWAFGHGLGTFATRFFMDSRADEQTGDWRVLHHGTERFAALSGGKHMMDFAAMFRVSQRIAVPQGPLSLQFDARAPAAAQVSFEVCEKHLLYPAECLHGHAAVPAGTAWTAMRLPLAAQPAIGRGDWYAPRLIAFAMGVENQGGRADVDNLRLVDASGLNLLANGDFSADGAHWFSSSDRVHMPWHMKGLLPHQLHDQGLVGAALLVALVVTALWRLTAGGARGHVLAPALAGALTGFLLVGISDSLLDVPRVAFLFYLLLMVALTLPAAAMATATVTATAGATTGADRKSPSTGSGSGAGARRTVFVLAVAVSLAALPFPPPTTAAALGAASPAAVEPLRLRVGPGREIATLAEAARRVTGRTLVEVDAGDYRGDVAIWDRGEVTLRAVGGRVRLHAAGAAAEGKAIWVVRNARVDVQGFDFTGARVADGNGAGIRFESGALTVRDCVFSRNENGILTGSDVAATLSIEDSEFGHNGQGDGQSHNLYVGAIASLSVVGSWFHHAEHGHLLKSRAARNHVAYNRLADGADGHASYELEFPNGGVAVVVGNLIEQSAQTDNPTMVSFGAEGLRWTRNALYLVNNTLVDRHPAGGVMLRVRPGAVTVRALNNLLVGNGSLEAAGTASHNHRTTEADFAADTTDDAGIWRLGVGSRCAGQAIEPGRTDDGEPLRPTREYRHPRSTVPVAAEAPLQPGAWQRLARRGASADPATPDHSTRAPPVRQP